MKVNPASTCPLCGKCVTTLKGTGSSVYSLLGGAAPLYEHMCSHDCCQPIICPVCGFNGKVPGLGWSEAFLVSMHWCMSQDLDEVEHIIRASLGELFLTREAMR